MLAHVLYFSQMRFFLDVRAEHEESSHADSNPCFDEIPEDNPESEREPWVDDITRVAQAEAGTDDCQAPRRPLDRANSKWDSMESDFISNRLKQPA